MKETIKNDAYLNSCECPNCGNYIRRSSKERIFFCEECGTHLHQRAFTQEEIDKALFDNEMDSYED
jgi:ribosomal protein L37AE/L43A